MAKNPLCLSFLQIEFVLLFLQQDLLFHIPGNPLSFHRIACRLKGIKYQNID